jgi:hypothetical protein
VQITKAFLVCSAAGSKYSENFALSKVNCSIDTPFGSSFEPLSSKSKFFFSPSFFPSAKAFFNLSKNPSSCSFFKNPK